MFMSCFSSCVSRPECPECSRPRIKPLLDATAAGYRSTTQDGKIENIAKRSIKNDRAFIICLEMPVGITAPRWWWSQVGPLFSDQRSRSCSRMRFCSTLDLLQQLSDGSNFTEATESRLKLQPKTLVHDQLCVWLWPKRRSCPVFERSCALAGGGWCAMLTAADTGVRGNNDNHLLLKNPSSCSYLSWN